VIGEVVADNVATVDGLGVFVFQVVAASQDSWKYGFERVGSVGEGVIVEALDEIPLVYHVAISTP